MAEQNVTGVAADPPADRDDRDLHALAEIAAGICDVPTAVVNLLDETSQHQVAAVGVTPSVCARGDAMCAVTVAQPEPLLVVPDARADARFATNPFVDGRLAALRFYAAAQLRTPDGPVVGTLCVFDRRVRTLTAEQGRRLGQLAEQVVDVLELRRRSRELRAEVAELTRARGELLRSNEHLAAFAGQVAHDLRSPLTGVLGWLDELSAADGVRSDPHAERAAARAAAAGRRMDRMLRALLDHARVGGGAPRDRVELDAVLADVLEDLREPLRGARVDTGSLPAVLGDASALAAVLANLLDNAVKYASPERALRIAVRGERADGRVRVEVVDNGIGIPPGRRAAALQPLVRVHGDELGDRDPGGTGLGLDTCRRIVRAHGGDLVLTGAPGGGTRVALTLADADAPAGP